MRVICECFEDFLENLQIDDDQNLFEDVIRVSISKRSVSEASKKVVTICSTLIQNNESEYLVEYAEDCGYDYSDGSDGPSGSDRANAIKKALEELATVRGWRIKPGILGV